MSTLDVLIDARVLLLGLTSRVCLPGQDLPDDDEPLIRLDPVSEVDRLYARRETATLTRIQVTTWAADLDTALPLAEAARELLLDSGFQPDGGGMLTDPDTKQIGWRADYRRQ
ncbi:hypothetical protein [uncultured Deinococcus sp.]|uniref:hypothetical protein n=1 Tax=uncultured Deinococcus sp. TaxID=158789 RepID=UPI00258E8F1A|nr:hypothetical protein [uncultured Deinococcus sp.]